MKTDVILIGGSAGAFNVILSILNNLDKSIDTPIVIVLHRLKNSVSSFEAILQRHSHYQVKEIEDKEALKKRFYLYCASRLPCITGRKPYFFLRCI